ncbi:hypothetical protein ACSSS7_003626 [Eimeria intestinalis]
METDGLSACPAAAAPAATAKAAAAAAGDQQFAAASEEGALLCNLYAWLDTLPLSRPKRNLHRDFADGVLMAEVANHCIPRIADLHNYRRRRSNGKAAEALLMVRPPLDQAGLRAEASPAPPSQADRDATIRELEETNAILNAKADSLQKLLQLRVTQTLNP